MTWTLRFYDGDGVEIGYVKMPDRNTFNVTITHPDSDWDDFKSELETYNILSVPDYGLESTEWRASTGPDQLTRKPERHLTVVEEQFSHPDIGSTALNDE